MEKEVFEIFLCRRCEVNCKKHINKLLIHRIYGKKKVS